MKTIVGIEYASTVEQLKAAVARLQWDSADVVYVQGVNGRRLEIKLLETVCSDGSIVYNLIFQEEKE